MGRLQESLNDEDLGEGVCSRCSSDCIKVKCGQFDAKRLSSRKVYNGPMGTEPPC